MAIVDNSTRKPVVIDDELEQCAGCGIFLATVFFIIKQSKFEALKYVSKYVFYDNACVIK